MTTLADWAVDTPDAVAIRSDAGDRTFSELDGAANRLARALRRLGLGVEDRVALLCGNRPEFAEVYYACQRTGIRLTPVNWHLTADEIAYIVTDCEAKVLIADSAQLSAVEALAASPHCKHGLAIGGSLEGFADYAAVAEGESSTTIEDQSPGGLMMYTSGTTGRPKGVFRPLGSVPASATGSLAGYEPGDCHLLTGPLYHAAPLAFSMSIPIACGASVVMTDHFDAESALRLIDKYQVTHTHMVPTMFHRLLALPSDVRDKYSVASLRYILHGAAPCPVPVKQAMIEWVGPIISEYYAATEGFATFVDSETWLEHPGTVGKPFTADFVIVGNEEGEALPTGEVGLVFIQSPAAMRFSYYKDDEKTSSTFRGDYFTLGDVGYFDADGFLYLTDRSANLIISGGVNIYPAEVDAVLLEHPAVGDVATIGVPDSEWGEKVLAVVELRDGYQASEQLAEELIDFTRHKIAHYKCPRAVAFEATLPRSDNGKIYKRVLRDRYRAELVLAEAELADQPLGTSS